MISSLRAVPTALLAAGILLSGCGGDDPASTEAAATANAEATANAADVDVPADEVVGAIDREAEGGERPEDLPDDVPVPAGLSGVLSLGGDGRTQAFTGHVAGSTPSEVRDELAAQLEAAGWEVDARDGTGGTDVDTAGLEAEDGDRRYTAVLVEIGELVNCQITYTGA